MSSRRLIGSVTTVVLCGLSAARATAQMHDAVVLMPPPLTVTIPAGRTAVDRRQMILVRNGDRSAGTAHPIQLDATSDCPAGTVTPPDFEAKTPTIENTVVVDAGKHKRAVVALHIASAAFTSFNHFVPQRCTLTFTASTPIAGNTDPTPKNNSVTLEVNVIDLNDPEQSGVHETFIPSIHVHHPKKVKLGPGTLSKVGRYRPALANGDLGDTPGDLITLTVSDGDCPPGSVGVADFDSATAGSQSFATVPGGAIRRGFLPVTIDGSMFTSPSELSPDRCTAILTATGPGGDTDASNNTTQLVINVIDASDF